MSFLQLDLSDLCSKGQILSVFSKSKKNIEIAQKEEGERSRMNWQLEFTTKTFIEHRRGFIQSPLEKMCLQERGA